jgi:AraC-like DNA-binding protein
VLYLDTTQLPAHLTGAAVAQPGWCDPVPRHRIHQLHRVLAQPGEQLHAQSRLELITERLGQQLRHHVTEGPAAGVPRLARRPRELLAAHLVTGLTLEQAARRLQAHPTHLVRASTRAHGLPPHRYLTGGAGGWTWRDGCCWPATGLGGHRGGGLLRPVAPEPTLQPDARHHAGPLRPLRRPPGRHAGRTAPRA